MPCIERSTVIMRNVLLPLRWCRCRHPFSASLTFLTSSLNVPSLMKNDKTTKSTHFMSTTMSFWCNIKALHTARISILNLLILHLIIWSICLCHNISGMVELWCWRLWLHSVKKFSLVNYVQCWIYVNARATRYDWIQFYIFVDILKWLRIVEWNDNNKIKIDCKYREGTFRFSTSFKVRPINFNFIAGHIENAICINFFHWFYQHFHMHNKKFNYRKYEVSG